MKAFTASLEGKKYLRLKAGAEQRNKVTQIRARFLGGKDSPQEPKRPASAYFIFVAEKRSSVSGKMGDIAKELTKMWSTLTPEEKKVYESKAEDLKKDYEQKLAEYKSSADFQKYDKAMRAASGRPQPRANPTPVSKAPKGKAKAKGKGKAKAAPKPSKKDDSDEDIMGSDSSNSSSDTDSD